MLTQDHSNHTNTTVASHPDDVILPSVVLGLLTIGTIFGNGLVCVAFHKVRSLRIVTNYFIVSLAVADLLIGFVSMPLWFTSVVFHWPTAIPPSGVYILWMCLDIASATASIMNLAVISIDRYYAITSPFQYPMNLTKNRACIYIVLVWAYASGVAALRATPLFGVWYSYFIATASFFVPLPVMVFCYVCIFRVARLHATKLRKLEERISYLQMKIGERNSLTGTSNSIQSTATTECHLEASSSHVNKHRTSFKSELKAAKTLGIVMGAFMVCWTPYIITLLIDVSCNHCIPSSRLKVLAQVVKWLHYSNSLLNPIIYAMLNRGFREGFMRVLCKQVCTKSVRKNNPIFYRHLNGSKPDYAGEILECVEKLSVV